MTYKGNSLPCFDRQIEAGQHGLLLGILEKHIFEFDASVQARHRLLINLLHTRFGIDKSEDTFAGREPKLKLTPERGNTCQRKPEDADTLHKEKPFSRRDTAAEDVQSAKVDDDCRTDIGYQEQQGKDSVVDKAGAHIHMI